jgi:hypothetical protein
MKNKKAMLVKEVIFIVLVIFSLTISGYFVYKISKSVLGNQDKLQATSTLNEIINKIDYLEEKNIDNDSVLLLNPCEWYILINPNKNNEICICKDKEFKNDNICFCELSNSIVKIESSFIKIVKNKNLFINKKQNEIFLLIEK